MGLCNLRHVNEVINGRKRVYERYEGNLAGACDVKLFKGNPEANNNYSYFPVLFKDKGLRDKVYEDLKGHNIFSRKYFYPLTSDHPCFKNKYRKCGLDVARDLSDRVLVLPFYDELSDADIDRICSVINKATINDGEKL